MRYQVDVTSEEVRLLLEEVPAGLPPYRQALLVGRDKNLFHRVAGILREEQFFVHFCPDPVTAVERCRHEDFDLIIAGVCMRGLDGVEMFTLIKQILPSACRVLLSGITDKATLIRAINNARIDAVIEDPLCDEALRSLVTGILPITR